jgi:hypothetical protein
MQIRISEILNRICEVQDSIPRILRVISDNAVRTRQIQSKICQILDVIRLVQYVPRRVHLAIPTVLLRLQLPLIR